MVVLTIAAVTSLTFGWTGLRVFVVFPTNIPSAHEQKVSMLRCPTLEIVTEVRNLTSSIHVTVIIWFPIATDHKQSKNHCCIVNFGLYVNHFITMW